MIFRIGEMPGFCYQEAYHPSKRIDRSQRTVDEYFKDENLEWTYDLENADVWIRKAELTFDTPLSFADENRRIDFCKNRPTLFLIAEPREHTAAAYALADPRTTMAVSPGKAPDKVFKMLYERAEWEDPQLENWSKRKDRACFIGRPTAARLTFLEELRALGVEIDIYSREPWRVPEWKGGVADELAVAREYKFRFVFETTHTHLCHSEKLFLSLRSGCMSFYEASPDLDLSFLKGSFLRWSPENWKNRHELSAHVLEGMNQFLFTDAWEIYSYREYYKRIIIEAKRIHEENPLSAKYRTAAKIEGRRPLQKLKWKEHYETALEYIGFGKLQEALTEFLKSREILGVGISQLDANIGLIYIEMKQLDEALKILSELTERDPHYPEGWQNLGIYWMRLHEYEKALEAFQKAKLSPFRSALTYKNLGSAFAHLNRFDEAIEILKDGIDEFPEYHESKLELAAIYAMTKQFNNARALVEDRLAAEPHNPIAIRLRAYLDAQT